ncbi:MAG: hypothetical protein KDK76_03150 [Chlamydiia bacterium]|nr:hypothetical protein [Chlamydiia bacterium]
MSGVSGAGGKGGPIQPEEGPKQVQTGMDKAYSGKTSPEFEKWLTHWFPQAKPQDVKAFIAGMMQMIQSSMNESKREQRETEEEVKKRIEGG